MVDLLLSRHQSKHSHEKWNQVTIRDMLVANKLLGVQELPGDTADVIYGFTPEGSCVGLIVTKERNGQRVIITGFESEEDYWLNV